MSIYFLFFENFLLKDHFNPHPTPSCIFWPAFGCCANCWYVVQTVWYQCFSPKLAYFVTGSSVFLSSLFSYVYLFSIFENFFGMDHFSKFVFITFPHHPAVYFDQRLGAEHSEHWLKLLVCGVYGLLSYEMIVLYTYTLITYLWKHFFWD